MALIQRQPAEASGSKIFLTGQSILEARLDHEPIQVGDKYLWLWHGYPDGTQETGSILDCNGTDHLVFSFGKAGVCTVRIYEEQGATLVELRQDEIPDDDKSRLNYHAGCMAGWTFYLANLKSLMEGGIDLRNRNTALKRMINS